MSGATPGTAFRAVAHEALAQIEQNARGVLASDDPEFLHQLRVGQRRLRSALRAFRGVLAKDQAKNLRRALRSLSPKLGAARDWDVLVGRLERSAAAPDLLACALKERDRARKTARRAVGSKAFARLAGEVRGITANETTDSLSQFGAAALARARHKLMKAARDIDWQDPAQRHALRVRVKRLRYCCEFFAPAFPAKRAATYIAGLKALQETLGALNDIAVGRRLIGFGADEAALLRSLRSVWNRFLKQPAFWRAPG